MTLVDRQLLTRAGRVAVYMFGANETAEAALDRIAAMDRECVAVLGLSHVVTHIESVLPVATNAGAGMQWPRRVVVRTWAERRA
jgi:hypothetical protein